MNKNSEKEHIKKQGQIYNQDTDPIRQIWHNHFNYISFALPFIFFRVLTPFKPGETITTRLVEGSVYAATATAVEYGVTHQQLKDYKLSYLPVVGSFLYKQNPVDGNKAISLVSAAIGVGIVDHAWQTSNLQLIMSPVITYIACTLSNAPKKTAAGLSAIATTIDYSLNYGEHYASWSVVGGAIVQNSRSIHPILETSEVKYKALTVAGAAIAGNLAHFEPLIWDQLFTPDHFEKSYNSIFQFVDHNNFNLALQKQLIYGANTQLCLGYFGNYLSIGKQGVDNRLVAITNANQKNVAFKDFRSSVATYMLKYLLPYVTVKLISETLIVLNNKQIINMVENELIENNLLTNEMFIQSAKSNYTVQSYLKDVTTISDDLRLIQASVFGLPKIVQLGDKINPVAISGLGAILLGDMVIKKLFSYLTQLKQFYENRKIKCDSEFDSITAYDREYAITISQKDGLQHTLNEWSNLQKCKQDNLLLESVLSCLVDFGQFFYVGYTLYTGLHILVGYLSMQGTIKADELFLYTKALELTSDALLFKSKNMAVIKKIEAAVIRLNELEKFLNSGENTLAKVNYKVNSDGNIMSISGLDFTRGNKEQKAHLHIDNLELSMGNTYTVTGSNGSGKSSFTTLLKYVFDHITDRSFNVTSGNIVYPDDTISMVPQKDYIPYNSRLLDIILYPNKIDNLTLEEENKIVIIVNELQVFAKPISSNDLYQSKSSWNDLSGGQKKKLFMVKPLDECPKVLIMDETFGPLDPEARGLLMDKISNSCLKESLLFVVWHQDKNKDGTSCVKDTFFDYELHVQNGTLFLGQVGVDCLN